MEASPYQSASLVWTMSTFQSTASNIVKATLSAAITATIMTKPIMELGIIVYEIIKNRAAFLAYAGDYKGSPDMNETNIMKEIRARGPVCIGIISPLFIQYYKSGVINCKEILMPDPEEYTETKTEILKRIRDEFRLVEHAVSIVGWGETEAGEKYWIVQNSYSFEIWHESSTIN